VQVKYANGVVHSRDNYLKTVTKVGLVFLIIGFLLLATLFSLVILFAVGGGPGEPGLPSPWGGICYVLFRVGDFLVLLCNHGCSFDCSWGISETARCLTVSVSCEWLL